ncbi:hypothetical protein [Thioalkalivibrio sp. ALE16]|uniref:hypothetical protein n=1 Tax=Thioalkalivibrio sp. ALE16 TaxID=1158172 RepID=UPI0003A9B0F7|nr:hypothetical protein [Thioalkalivibrio sp. ALE16]
MTYTATSGRMVQIAVDWFDPGRHPDFVEWVTRQNGQGLATWLPAGEYPDLGGYPDVFVGVDPSFSGEGTDSGMPDPYWSEVVQAARDGVGDTNGLHAIVWIRPDPDL